MKIFLQLLTLVVFLHLSFQPVFGDTIDAETKFKKAGLIDISTIDSSIQVDLVNSNSKKNFFRENYYNGLKKAYLRKEIAIKLANAQKVLKSKYPDYSLLVLDAARPRSVSKLMFDKMKGTKFEKYVANPKKGSMHNFGIAVDISIVDKSGNEIDMGFTPFNKNHFEIYWQYFLKKVGFGLSDIQKQNRKLLTDVMTKAGFIPLSFEWWHFNGMEKSKARKKYKIIE